MSRVLLALQVSTLGCRLSATTACVPLPLAERRSHLAAGWRTWFEISHLPLFFSPAGICMSVSSLKGWRENPAFRWMTAPDYSLVLFLFLPIRSEIELNQHALAQKSTGLAHWGIARHVWEDNEGNSEPPGHALPMECSKLEEVSTLLYQGDKSRQASGRGYCELLCRQKGWWWSCPLNP